MKELITALINVQKEITSVSRDSQNPFFKSRYTSLAHLTDKLYPILSKHQFAVSQAIQGDFLETRLMHTSGQELVSKAPLLYKEGDMQKLGAAISYMRRYSLMAIVGITSDDDDDAQSLQKPQQTMRAHVTSNTGIMNPQTGKIDHPMTKSGFSNQPSSSTVKAPLPNKAPQTQKEADDWTKQYEKHGPRG